jgi:hypothetical protein
VSVRAVDLPRVQRALRDLDVLVTEHPELCQGDAPERLAEWLDAEQIDSAEDTD